jgi:hypothetical protein
MPVSRVTTRPLIFAALAMLLPAAARACPPPASLATAAATLRQDFIETRSLTGLPAPLRSSGYLAVTPDQVEWHTTAPFDIDTTITPAGMRQSVDGGPAQAMASGDGAFDGQMSKIVSSLMRGQWHDLATIFRIATAPQSAGQNWRVTLRPLDPKLAAALGEITVEGCTSVTSFQLTQPNGDAERIQLSQPSSP